MILFFGSGFPPQISTKIATLGRIGYWGKAPGTNGSFVGLIWYTLLFHDLSPFFYLLLCFLTVQTAIGVCTQAERGPRHSVHHLCGSTPELLIIALSLGVV